MKQIALTPLQLPTTRQEDWRYTDVSKLVGRYRPAIAEFQLTKQPRGVQLVNKVLTVAAGTKLQEPLVLTLPNLGANTLVRPKLKVRIGAGALVNLHERYNASGAHNGLIWPQIDFELDPLAQLSHIIEAASVARLITIHTAFLAEQTLLKSWLVSSGSALARHEYHVRLAGKGANADLRGLLLATQNHQVGCHTSVEHCSAATQSRQLYRAVVAGQASAITHSKVFVRHGATQATSEQLLKTLLLDSTAKGFARPELHVANHQVHCSHGAATGQLNPQVLFYLKSRGLTPHQAQRLLLRAFVLADAAANPYAQELIEGALDRILDRILNQP
ncbi:MAG: SufD family Fe-S cluster assembly protein [Parcubacteria group bacterium]